MCGICGIINIAGGPKPAENDILRMMDSLSHRGPDAGGYYHDQTAAIGHTRLSIIDLEAGIQPLSNENGTLWVSFNGEIFNYVELAGELKSRGHKFRTKSDTEVIVHAWEQWGEDCFRRFNGQWALALWDSKSRRLVLSRDRMGIRPLYYTFENGKFFFASEIKAIFSQPGIPRELDPDGMREIFTFWGPVAPGTAFRNIRELEPGYCAILESGNLGTKPYWNLEFPEAGKETAVSFDEAAEQLRAHITEAARIRFTRSDVPVGAYLSGGIDSSIITSIVARYTPSRLKTFSLTFTDSEFDEKQYQDIMVKRLGTDHQAVRVTPSDIGNIFPEVVFHAERPVLRTAPAPLFLLSRLVRRAGYKVVVTGEGSDEVLAGYDIFKELQARLFMLRDPESIRRKDILRHLYPWMERSPNKVPAFSQAFFGKPADLKDPGFSHRLRWGTSENLLRILSDEFLAGMTGQDPALKLFERMPAESRNWGALSRAQWLEIKTLLAGYILSAQGDRMLMANSVEGRFPYLDVNVVEFAARLPPEYKMFGLEEKYILKRAFSDMVPGEILNRPKQPYRAPDASSFFTQGKAVPWLDELVSPDNLSRSGLFRTGDIVKLFDKAGKSEGGKMSNTDNMRIVATASCLLLQKQFIDAVPDMKKIPREIITVIDGTDSGTPGRYGSPVPDISARP